MRMIINTGRKVLTHGLIFEFEFVQEQGFGHQRGVLILPHDITGQITLNHLWLVGKVACGMELRNARFALWLLLAIKAVLHYNFSGCHHISSIASWWRRAKIAQGESIFATRHLFSRLIFFSEISSRSTSFEHTGSREYCSITSDFGFTGMVSPWMDSGNLTIYGKTL